MSEAIFVCVWCLFQDEVNALIELTNKLKAEREVYKKRLQDVTSRLTSINERSLNNTSIDVSLASPQELMTSSSFKVESLSSSNKTLQCISPTASFWLASLSLNETFKSRLPKLRTSPQTRHSFCGQTLNKNSGINNGFSFGELSCINSPASESGNTLMTSVASSRCDILSPSPPNNEQTTESDVPTADRCNKDQTLCWNKQCLSESRHHSLLAATNENNSCEHCRLIKAHLDQSNRLSWPVSPLAHNIALDSSSQKRIS